MMGLIVLLVCVVHASLREETFLRQFNSSWIMETETGAELLYLIPYPNHMDWPAGRCSKVMFDVSHSGLSNLSALVPLVSERLIGRINTALNVDSKSFPELRSQIDGSVRLLVFQSIIWQRTVRVPQFGDDESFTLSVQVFGSQVQVAISAATSTGVVRAFAVLIQLLVERNRCIPVGLRIVDAPAFGWRGLMVDTARRFVELESLKQLCSGLEMARMNVLHLHLTDDQGWRFESKIWTLLQLKGSVDSRYYSQQSLADLVAYCAVGGVRVVPEIDLPGHSAAAIFAYGSLAPNHIPASFVTDWGVFDYALDFTRLFTSAVVRDVLNEVIAVFPDSFVHVGGDEVRWPLFSATQNTWLAARNLTQATLQQYVQNTLIFPILAAKGRRVMGWTEIYTHSNGQIPASAAVQWWLSASLSPANINVISAGFFLDRMLSVEDLYLSNFLASDDDGAEACLWREGVGSNLETRVFPGLLAFAELLWRGVDRKLSVDSMLYRTFVQDIGSLAIAGVQHQQIYSTLVQGLIESETTLRTTLPIDTLLVDLLLPTAGGADIDDPLQDVLDAARPTSPSLQMLVWLSQIAIEREKFDPDMPATQALVEWLSALAFSEVNVFGPGLEPIRQNMSANANTYLHWIEAVQTNKNGERLRQTALVEGELFFPGILNSGRFVWNGLKLVLEPVLLARSVGPFNYLVTTAATTTTTTTTTTSPDQVSGVISGSVVGAVVLLGVVVTLTLLVVLAKRRKTEKIIVAAIEESPTKSPFEYVESGVEESYVDYLDSEDGEDQDLFVRRGISSYTDDVEPISSTSLSLSLASESEISRSENSIDL